MQINKIYCGDAKHLMMDLDRESVDVCITSPPYWGLRDYGVEQQIGLEETPQEYIQKLVRTFHWLKKALKKTGSFYLNLGDTYYGGGTGQDKSMSMGKYTKGQFLQAVSAMNKTRKNAKFDNKWLQSKQLLLIPSRTAIALQEDGWILRNDIIWQKPNCMPHSVKDRLNTTYEHLFHFVRNNKYYYDLDSIREPHTSDKIEIERQKRVETTQKITIATGQKGCSGGLGYSNKGKNPGDFLTYRDMFETGTQKYDNTEQFQSIRHRGGYMHPMGKNPGDFVKVTSTGTIEKYDCASVEYSKHKHTTRDYHELGKNPGDIFQINTYPYPKAHFAVFPPELLVKPLKSSCPNNGVVLDPFIGSGTVAYVCKYPGKFGIKKKLNYIGFEINPTYIKLANKRLSQETLLALTEIQEGDGGINFTQNPTDSALTSPLINVKRDSAESPNLPQIHNKKLEEVNFS